MATKHDLLRVLSQHIGWANGVTADALARQLEVPPRAVRHLVTELRCEGVAVVATPERGYYIAETAEELESCCAFLRARAMHSLVMEARLRRLALEDLLGQLRLPT